MKTFVSKDSIVRKIWGKSDTVLFIFAGASAEFALNKAVDWLYFTGKLPADPIGRLFSTVSYARRIIFSTEQDALRAIDSMSKIHSAVENNRGYSIPDWAYRDVLFMLIYYSIASFELLQRRLTEDEKQEVYDVFYRVGARMGLKEIPATYKEWLPVRDMHLEQDLELTKFTKDLFLQYKKNLGNTRYKVLVEGQKLVVPGKVSQLLDFNSFQWIKPIVPLYKFSRLLKFDGLVKRILLPAAYQDQIRALDVV